jgi:hypothetical protein
MGIYKLSSLEEIIVLIIRVEMERDKVLFIKGDPYYDKAIKKIDKFQKRIVKLGGNHNLKFELKEEINNKEKANS